MTTLPTAPEDIAVMAGEYVLGTLDARAAAAVAAAMARDPAWRDAVAAWEREFAPLTALALPEAPPPELWPRIEAALGGDKPRAPARARTHLLLRLWAGAASGVAIAFAMQLFVYAPPRPTMTAVLVPDQGTPVFTAAATPGGFLRIAAVPADAGTLPAPPAGRAFELWGLAPGDAAPVSLGVMPPGATSITIEHPAVLPRTGMQIMISVEPPGGSPTGKPTGKVVYFGRLERVGPPV
jgi:anti-sigma-K factor RskA